MKQAAADKIASRVLGSHWAQATAVSLLLTLCIHWQVAFAGKTFASASLLPSVFAAGKWDPSKSFDELNSTEQFLPSTVVDASAAVMSDEVAPYVSHRLFQESGMPWLNRYQGMGQPWAANMMSSVFSPLHLLPTLYPTPAMWDVYLLMRVVLFGMFTFVYLRGVGLGAGAATVGVVLAVGGGYTVGWINLVHFSVDLWLPLLLHLTEKWVRGNQPRLLAGIAMTMAVAILGGNPQPVMLFAPALLLYALMRSAAAGKMRVAQLGKRAFVFISIFLLSAGLAAFLLVPFLELYRQSFHLHHQAASSLHVALPNLLFALYPVLYQPTIANVLVQPFASALPFPLFGPGVAGTVLVAIAVTFGWRHHRSLLTPFVIVAGLLFFKLVGWDPGLWEWIPLYRNLITSKYQVLFVFSLIVMASVGCDTLIKSARGSRSASRGAAITVFIAAIACGMALHYWLQSYGDVLQLSIVRGGAAIALPAALVLTFAVPLGLFVAMWLAQRAPRAAAVVVVLLLVAEALMNTARPYARRGDNYVAPPFIEFLRARTSNHPGRIFNSGLTLVPNTASVFGVEDFGHFDTLVWKPFYDFARNLVTGNRTELLPTVTGSVMQDVVHNPMHDVAGVRYIVTDTSPNAERTTNRLWAEAGASGGAEILRNVRLFSRPRTSIVLSAGEKFSFGKGDISAEDELRMFLTIRPSGSTNQPQPLRLEIHAENLHGTTLLHAREFRPDASQSDRRWFAMREPIGKFSGSATTFTLRVESPSLQPGFDGLFADISFRSDDSKDGRLRLIYDQEVLIYENLHVLPRARTVQSAEVCADSAKLAARVKELGAGVREKVLFIADRQSAAAVKKLKHGSNAPAIRTEKSAPYHRVYHVTGKEASIFFVADAAYPGWSVFIDGKRVPLLRAFGALQSAYVPAGSHKVEFSFVPRSAIAGLMISLLSAVILIIIWWFPRLNASRYGSSVPLLASVQSRQEP